MWRVLGAVRRAWAPRWVQIFLLFDSEYDITLATLLENLFIYFTDFDVVFHLHGSIKGHCI